ncbi:hypothetical protein C5748_10635 [Phyllobacterium phragmitis]|uniref:Aminotransferase class I/classII large domain-containing protein n=1 Tax=Phyllobacterium phragmitis TaxID=2670329 RepID=A0A2S9IT37_9HYPH|nr:PLP-dependent aminotransferase family protein [Phyllobacterium phragmitis]PRD43694.1 hypothetical protein C5748_10635 [Phyllobacterium phragmitis]
MNDRIIDLSRAVPPVIHELETSLADRIASRLVLPGANGLLRTNRPRGTEEDRVTGSKWLSQRLGSEPSPDRILVTNGTLNILFLLLNQLVGKDGTLLTEEMTYPNMQALSGMLGFPIVGIPMDEQGLDPVALEEVCQRINTPKVLYTIPTMQNPTATVMPIGRREQVVGIARKYDVKIIEDDAQALMIEDAPLPLATFAPERTWYVMGLAKTVVMGLRVAYLATPDVSGTEALMSRFGKMSMWFVAALQAELAHALISSGVAGRATAAIRDIATERRRIVAEILDRPGLLAFPRGLHVWVPTSRDAVDIAQQARSEGVLVRPGKEFAAKPGESSTMNGLRISFCETREERDLRQGLAIVAALLD